MSPLLIIIYNINQKGDQNITNSEEIDDPNVGTLILNVILYVLLFTKKLFTMFPNGMISMRNKYNSRSTRIYNNPL